MANEIIVLESSQGGLGQFLFSYPIATPKMVNNYVVVPTAMAGLPQVAKWLLDDAAKVLYDQGRMAYEQVQLKLPGSYTTAQLIAYVRTVYAAYLAAYLVAYDERYRYTGTGIASA